MFSSVNSHCLVIVSWLLQRGVREKLKIRYNTALGVIFGVKKYATELLKVVERKDIQINFKRSMVEVDAVNSTAIFDVLEEERQESYKVSLFLGVDNGRKRTSPTFLSPSPLPLCFHFTSSRVFLFLLPCINVCLYVCI